MARDRSAIVTARVSLTQQAKLKALASRTERTISQVMRLLIDRAEVRDTPDIRLRSQATGAERN